MLQEIDCTNHTFLHLNQSLGERNTGFTQVLVNLVVVILRKKKYKLLSEIYGCVKFEMH